MSDILIAAKQIEKTRAKLCEIIAERSGRPFDKVLADVDQDYWMTSNEALEYGMTDSILAPKMTYRLLSLQYRRGRFFNFFEKSLKGILLGPVYNKERRM